MPVPTVSLNEVVSPSVTRNFLGTTDEKGVVKVVVYQGTTPEGRSAGTAEVNVAENGCSLSKTCKWASGPIHALFEKPGVHVFTAVAVQKSGITGREGVSNPVTFEVDAEAPKVLITHLSPQIEVTPGNEITTKENKPAFSGTASDPRKK